MASKNQEKHLHDANAIIKEKPARLCANKDMHLGRASNMVWREGDLRPINEQKSINTV